MLRHPENPPKQQQGAAIIFMLLIVILGIASLLVSSLNHTTLKINRDQKTTGALSLAKMALIGDSVSQMPITSAGYLRLPDLGFTLSMIPAEGSAAPNFSGNNKDYSVIGKLPWRTLGLEPLYDGQGECLWYMVSGHFKNTPSTNSLNWDTPGQINLVDAGGNIIANNLAAVIVATGPALDGQNRTQSDAAYTQCGGNYDARNYLDPYVSSNAASEPANYFSGSLNNRVTANTFNSTMTMKGSPHNNDRFLLITPDEIFRIVIHRADFSMQISSLLHDVYFQNVIVSGSKGTGNVNCDLLDPGNRSFCKNWLEMLLLTQLSTPSPVSIDGALTGECSRILIFGGAKNVNQLRLSSANKASPANYLEGVNLAAFATPVALAGHFAGTSLFNASHPGTDVLSCLS
jgi:hypothetical protein